MITTEWCTTRASSAALEAFYGSYLHAEEKANLCEALTIAARVLDEGAVERLARIIDEMTDARTSYNEEAYIRNTDEVSRAVLAYLKGEK